MASPSANDIFIRIPVYSVIVCRHCQSAVRPTQVVSHLTHFPHRTTIAQARLIQTTIEEWDEVAEDVDRLSFPMSVETPIEGLAIHTDGILCTQVQGCGYVCRTTESIRKHWRTEHGWSPYGQRGRQDRHTPRPHAVSQAAIQGASRTVTCQRFFTTQFGSHYIHIRRPGPSYEPVEPPAPASVVQALVSQLDQQFSASQARDDTVIQAGELDEANPWLRRTGWAPYLQGVPVRPLSEAIATPEEDAEGIEGAVRAIWDAMDGAARVSQRITKQCGHLIRIEAARTDQDQSPHQPLQAYMDIDNIQRHVEPWQRVLMFFARTQQPHTWRSPRYRFISRQQRAWQALWRCAQLATQGVEPTASHRTDQDPDEDPEPYILTPIQQACMDFCVELLNQRVGAEEYECALVCALAVLGRGRDGWQTADSYPPILSKMIKIARFMVLHKALRLDPHADEIVRFLQHRQEITAWGSHSPMDDPEYLFAGQDEGYGSQSDTPTPEPGPPDPIVRNQSMAREPGLISFSQQRRQGSRPFREWLKLLVDTFMVRGTHSPMQWMLDLRTYGLRVHYNSTAPGHIAWIGPDELLYKEVHFTIGDFRGFVHGLVGSVRDILHDELLITTAATPVPSIPWDRLMDDPTQAKPGWSFLQDSRTPWPVDGAQWMMQRLTQDAEVQRQFINAHEQQFRTSAIQRYIQRVVRFREQLSVAIHVVAGQPSRAPELLSIRHRNTEGGHRNIFIEDGLVVFASRYHKGFYAQNDAKTIHRYLPREVGELVVWYLWLVLPFVERLQVYQASQQARQLAGHSSYEHPVQTSHAAYLWPPDPSTGREWTSERFREVLKRETAIGLHGHSLNIPAYRDIAIGISRRFLRVSSVFPNNIHDRTTDGSAEVADDESQMDHDQFMGHIADLQAAHSSHVAGMIYGREVSEQAGTTAHRRELFRLSSTDWHRFLGFTSYEDPLGRVLGQRKRAPWQMANDEARDQRRWQLRETNMTDAVRQMTGNDQFEFRGVQGPAIRAIQHGASPVVAVMPTGGGKSMLFMLPAWVGGGLTVVVVPLIALRADLQARCATLGISCVAWDSRRPPDEASIVLVTPESALSADFTTFLNRQRFIQRLDRIVIDECHIMLNRDDTFRPMMQQLGRLIAAQTQMVFLTATLPPSAEARLWQRMRCTRADVELYRGRTSRSNIAYRVWRPPVDRGYAGPNQWIQMDRVIQFVRERIQRVPVGRVIIYGSTTTHVGMIASELQCEAFYSRQDDKTGIIERFRQGRTGVIAATSALGMGLDIPDIRSVIHIGWPRTMLDYAQESGRAGRDGFASEAIIIQPAGMDIAPPWIIGDAQAEPDIDAQAAQQRLSDYITAQPGQCRRMMLDQYLDGTVDGYQRVRCGDSVIGSDEAQCDGCEPNWQAYEPAIGRRRAKRRRRSISPPGEGGRGKRIKGEQGGANDISRPVVQGGPGAVGRPARTTVEARRVQPGSIQHDRATSSGSESIQSQERGMQGDSPPARTTIEFRREKPGPVQHNRGISSGSESIQSQERGMQGDSPPARTNAKAIRAIPGPVQHEFRRQDIQRRAMQHAYGAGQQVGFQELEFLEGEAQRWQERCWTCSVHGLDDGHDLYGCGNAANQRAQSWYMTWRSRIRYAAYACCYGCGMPQSVCEGHRTKGGCVYRYVLMPMYAMMVYGDSGEDSEVGRRMQRVQQAWQQQLGSYGVSVEDGRAEIQFLGQEAGRGPIRQTELVAGFIWLRRAYEDYHM